VVGRMRSSTFVAQFLSLQLTMRSRLGRRPRELCSQQYSTEHFAAQSPDGARHHLRTSSPEFTG
jgi:hypothetical protein